MMKPQAMESKPPCKGPVAKRPSKMACADSCKGMGDSFVGETEFLELTKDTFRLLSSLDSNQSIPNSVARILVLMQEFAVYCWFSGKLRRLNMWMIVSHLLYNFLDGFEKSGSIYPKLKLTEGDNLDYFDFTTNKLMDILLSNEVPF